MRLFRQLPKRESIFLYEERPITQHSKYQIYNRVRCNPIGVIWSRYIWMEPENDRHRLRFAPIRVHKRDVHLILGRWVVYKEDL